MPTPQLRSVLQKSVLQNQLQNSLLQDRLGHVQRASFVMLTSHPGQGASRKEEGQRKSSMANGAPGAALHVEHVQPGVGGPWALPDALGWQQHHLHQPQHRPQHHCNAAERISVTVLMQARACAV